MVIFKKHEKSNGKSRKIRVKMKTRYFKTNQEYFNFVNKYRNRLVRSVVSIKPNKIKIQYEV